MILDIDSPLLSLCAAARRVLPQAPSPPTFWRWRVRGVAGIRLQSWVVGGRIYTTEAAFREFIRQTTEARATVRVPQVEPTSPARRLPRVSDEQLRAAGLL